MSKEEALNVWNFFHEILETKIMQQKLNMSRLVLKQKVAQVMRLSTSQEIFRCQAFYQKSR